MPRELKTHCPHGHEFTPDNTYVQKTGGRKCRACMNARSRARQAAKRAERNAGKKQCARCQLVKPFDQFGEVAVRRKGGFTFSRRSWCNACRSEVECARTRAERAKARRDRIAEHRAVCRWLYDRILKLWHDGATDDWLAAGLGISKHTMRCWLMGGGTPYPDRRDELVDRVQHLEAIWPRVRTPWDDIQAARRRNPKLSRTNPLTPADRQAT